MTCRLRVLPASSLRKWAVSRSYVLVERTERTALPASQIGATAYQVINDALRAAHPRPDDQDSQCGCYPVDDVARTLCPDSRPLHSDVRYQRWGLAYQAYIWSKFNFSNG
jgi:hypothetical protein